MEFLTNIFRSQGNVITPQDTQKKMAQKPKPFLLDVRQPEEYRQEHINGAKLIPLGELQARIKELPKNQEIICVCRSGNRSSSATRQLREAGYNAINMQGGMIAWSRSGLPVNRGR